MKQITDEQIEDQASTYAEDQIAVGDPHFLLETGFSAGAQWIRSKMEDQAPQSEEVMTLDADSILSSTQEALLNCSETVFYWKDAKSAMEEYASQFQAKSEALQAELDKVKTDRDTLHEALKKIKGLEWKYDIGSPSEKAIKYISVICNRAFNRLKEGGSNG